MNGDIAEGNWKQFKSKVKARWDKLTDHHLDVVAGKRGEVGGTIQEASPECMMKEEIPPRRVVLSGALAVGCSLFVPIALFSSPATGANAAAPTATKKVSKASVQYQTQPKGEQKCANCVNFIAESNTCKLVDGPISPAGWCSLWSKKA